MPFTLGGEGARNKNERAFRSHRSSIKTRRRTHGMRHHPRFGDHDSTRRLLLRRKSFSLMARGRRNEMTAWYCADQREYVLVVWPNAIWPHRVTIARTSGYQERTNDLPVSCGSWPDDGANWFHTKRRRIDVKTARTWIPYKNAYILSVHSMLYKKTRRSGLNK